MFEEKHPHCQWNFEKMAQSTKITSYKFRIKKFGNDIINLRALLIALPKNT